MTQARGERLFPDPGDSPTLATFFRDYYMPLRFEEHTCEKYRASFRTVLERWAALTGDPPLNKIVVDHLVAFKTFLVRMKIGPSAVASHLRLVQQLLDLAGPPMRGIRDGVGLIDKPPYIKPPKVPRPMPRVVPVGLINAVYQAVDGMIAPENPGIPAPAWWRALLVTTWNTGLRKRSLFEMEMADIRWDDCQIVLPPERLKSARWQIAPLNRTTIDHLQAIRTERQLVFPWPHSSDHYHKTFHALQDLAGIPAKDHFGLHRLRKTFATNMWSVSPQAAQLGCGHADKDVTIQHYVAGTAIIAEAVAKLPQPEAFTHSTP